MAEHGGEARDAGCKPRVSGSARGSIHTAGDIDSALLSEAALSDWNRAEEDAAWAHLQDAEPALTPMLQKAIDAAKALPQEDQDALAAAEILEWIEDERRWTESFARTHEALAEVAREALAEHHAGETLGCSPDPMLQD